MLIKLKRYMHKRARICPFCLKDASIGQTDWGVLGCRTCQKKVDHYMNNSFYLAHEI
jgi:hypothetical protein